MMIKGKRIMRRHLGMKWARMIGEKHKRATRINGKISHRIPLRHLRQQRQRILWHLPVHLHGFKTSQINQKMIGIVMHSSMMFWQLRTNRNWKLHVVNDWSNSSSRWPWNTDTEKSSNCSSSSYTFLSLSTFGVGCLLFFSSTENKKKQKTEIYFLWIVVALII